MPTTTTHLAFRSPLLADPFHTADLVYNLGIMDAGPGEYICTTTTRPTWTSNQAGMKIYETDSGLSWRWNGSAFVRERGLGILGTSSTTSNVALPASTNTVVAQVVVAAPTSPRSILLQGMFANASVATAVTLWRGGTQLCEVDAAANVGKTLAFTDTGMSAGSITYSLQVNPGSSTGTVTATSTRPASITALEI